MRYIDRDEDGGFVLDRYAAYAAAEHDRLSALMGGGDLHSVYRNGLEGRRTLHDAWLLELQVVHPIEHGEASDIRLRLLGAYHDRYFLIRYRQVGASRVEVPNPRDDLLAHEVRLEGDGLGHELLFASGRTIEIRCMGIELVEEPAEL